MTLFRSLALGAMLVAGAAFAKAAALRADSVMEAARGVAAYFMRTCPDVGADSHVGGKRRNSRIWTRGVFYEGLLNIYREEQRPEWLDYALSWGEFHRWYSCTDSQARHADFQCCGQAYLQLYMLDTTAVERMSHIKMRIDAMMATDRVDDWYWVDAIQMAMPIFAMLGTITGDGAYWERMHDMYMYTRNRQGGDRRGGGSPLNFVFVLVHIDHVNLFAHIKQQRLHALQDVGKQKVVRTFHKGGDGGLGLHLEITGIAVGLIATVADDSKDALACAVAHIGVLVQHPRDSSHAITR